MIGLSNVFDVAGDLESAWGSAAAAAAALWGDMSIVSYDLGDSLDAAHSTGFDSVGELAVWRKAPDRPDEPMARQRITPVRERPVA